MDLSKDTVHRLKTVQHLEIFKYCVLQINRNVQPLTGHWMRRRMRSYDYIMVL